MSDILRRDFLRILDSGDCASVEAAVKQVAAKVNRHLVFGEHDKAAVRLKWLAEAGLQVARDMQSGHAVRGFLQQMAADGFPPETAELVVSGIRDRFFRLAVLLVRETIPLQSLLSQASKRCRPRGWSYRLQSWFYQLSSAERAWAMTPGAIREAAGIDPRWEGLA